MASPARSRLLAGCAGASTNFNHCFVMLIKCRRLPIIVEALSTKKHPETDYDAIQRPFLCGDRAPEGPLWTSELEADALRLTWVLRSGRAPRSPSKPPMSP
jgi:hypothetical protein